MATDIQPSVLAKIGVRLVAIYVFAQALVYFPSAFILETNTSGNAVFPLAGALALIPVIGAAILWALASRIADYVVGADSDSGAKATLIEVQIVAIATVGLFLLFDTLPSLVTSVYITIVQAPEMEGVKHFRRDMVGNLIGLSLRMVLALALILGASFWSRALWRIRGIGSK